MISIFSDDADMTDEIPKMFTETGLSPVARDKSKRVASFASSGHQEDFNDTGKFKVT